MKAHTYTCNDFSRQLAEGPYTSVGSYPVFFWGQGFALCFGCARDERRRIRAAIRRTLAVQENGTVPLVSDPEWLLCGADINWESRDLFCDCCFQPIECAYPESEVAE